MEEPDNINNDIPIKMYEMHKALYKNYKNDFASASELIFGIKLTEFQKKIVNSVNRRTSNFIESKIVVLKDNEGEVKLGMTMALFMRSILGCKPKPYIYFSQSIYTSGRFGKFNYDKNLVESLINNAPSPYNFILSYFFDINDFINATVNTHINSFIYPVITVENTTVRNGKEELFAGYFFIANQFLIVDNAESLLDVDMKVILGNMEKDNLIMFLFKDNESDTFKKISKYAKVIKK